MLAKSKSPILLLLLISTSVSVSQPLAVNKAHLLALTEELKFEGDSIAVVDIYSNYPAYEPVDAKGEGFACVDDAARAAVFFMRYNEVYGKSEDERIIRGLINFVLRMQTSDGRFYNFLQRSGGEIQINESGRTSYACFGWWAARAIWALGEASTYFKKGNHEMYLKVASAAERSLPQLDSILTNYDRLDSLGYPTWLLYNDGGDAASELVLGLNRLYSATGDKRYLKMSGEFCDGMMRLQSGSRRTPPYSVFLSNHDGWHGWANSQSAAILEYSRLANDRSVAEKALQELESFFPRWAGSLFFRSCDRTGRNLDYSSQIAYAIQPAVSAAAEAFEITHDRRFKTLASILASWFLGNNTAKTGFYNSGSGICFDGTEDSLRVNRNSGAESTIEALLTMVDLKRLGADFKSIKLISRPSFDAERYIYEIDGRKVSFKMNATGFSIQ